MVVVEQRLEPLRGGRRVNLERGIRHVDALSFSRAPAPHDARVKSGERVTRIFAMIHPSKVPIVRIRRTGQTLATATDPSWDMVRDEELSSPLP